MVSARRTTQTGHAGNKRLYTVQLFVGIFAALLMYRLVDLQIVHSSDLREKAASQHATVRVLSAERGSILYTESKSNEEYPLATNREFFHVFVVPRDIEGIEKTFDLLLPLVEEKGISEDTLRYRLSKQNDIYEPLLHKVTDRELAPFKELALPGVHWEREKWRYYPEEETLSQVIGFVGVQGEDRVGQYGLEGFFEEELRGKDGLLEGSVDVTGRLIQTGAMRRVDPEPGIDIVLTIDRTIQAFACRELANQIKAMAATSGSVIIIDPDTGGIVTLCSEPTFNPNTYNKVADIQVYQNPVVTSTYEPGSVFKPITIAAGIDQQKITPETTYDDTGSVKVGDYTIRNSDGQAHGTVNMITVLDESLNTGTIFVQRLVGKKTFREYVEAFGFGEVTGLPLGGELAGNIATLYKPGDSYSATASYGHGITTTPMQVAMSYVAIANGGKLLKPYIVQEKRQGKKILWKAKTEVLSEPISLRTATIVTGMLASVVSSGHAKAAGVEGYYIAGKTGTAQIATAGGYSSESIHTFAGFGPVDKPAFVMLVKLDRPQNALYAAATSAPLFGRIAEFILQYYEIPPDDVR